MEENEKKLKFNQLMTKIIIGRFALFESRYRTLFLSKGILIAEKEAIYFYDYKKYSKTFIMFIDKEEKRNFRFSKLLNDKYCIYSLDETKIYQFNNKDYTVTLLQTINVNLKKLIEIDDNKFINITYNYFYIWKKLKSIYKCDQMLFIILILILNLLISFLLQHLEYHFINFINFITTIVLVIMLRSYVHLLNPYKRIKKGEFYHLEKCGKNICCLATSDYVGIYDYKNFKKIKTNNLNNQTTFFIINENIIMFTNEKNRECKIYNISLNRIINKFFCHEFTIYYNNTFKIGKNLYITIIGNNLIKWKYNLELNNIEVLEKNNFNYKDHILIKNIINNKLLILTQKLLQKGDYSLSLYIYQ